jgi:hypothetical protein
LSKLSSVVACLIVIATVTQLEVALGGDDAAQASRIAVQTDLIGLATMAQQFYFRPATKGGGQGSFVLLNAGDGLSKLTSKPTNSNGTYSILTAGTATSVVLRGLGTEKGTDGNYVSVEIVVFADSVALTFNN